MMKIVDKPNDVEAFEQWKKDFTKRNIPFAITVESGKVRSDQKVEKNKLILWKIMPYG